jgi:hypothetical protein
MISCAQRGVAATSATTLSAKSTMTIRSNFRAPAGESGFRRM